MNKLQMISCQKFCKTEDKVVTSLKFWGKNRQMWKHFVPGKSIFQIWRKREYIFRQIKAERINSKFALCLYNFRLKKLYQVEIWIDLIEWKHERMWAHIMDIFLLVLISLRKLIILNKDNKLYNMKKCMTRIKRTGWEKYTWHGLMLTSVDCDTWRL